MEQLRTPSGYAISSQEHRRKGRRRSLVCERRLKHSLAPQMRTRSCEAKEAGERRSPAKEAGGQDFPSLILSYPRSDRPPSRIEFAGEHVNGSGTIEGAVQSGIRAAARLAAYE